MEWRPGHRHIAGQRDFLPAAADPGAGDASGADAHAHPDAHLWRHALSSANQHSTARQCQHNRNGNNNNNGAGYYLVVQLDTPSYIDALWTLPAGTQDNIQLFVYSNTPTNQFAGQPDPTSLSPPSGQLVISAGGTSNSLEVRTSQSNVTGSYTAYFSVWIKASPRAATQDWNTGVRVALDRAWPTK